MEKVAKTPKPTTKQIKEAIKALKRAEPKEYIFLVDEKQYKKALKLESIKSIK